ncbi:MAG: ATP-grasp domain-containing protein [Candidatus Pacebacteria bacterium]|nr:ATP-grasp domain-containing protein [Candidatus Paceibacterota bacterium]MDR3583265.1 ATP-grasp domain-containing protein [Candidatus Paceibacterota bacterium]
MHLKFLIVSSKISELSQDLIDEIIANDHGYAFSTTRDFILKIEDGTFSASTPTIADLFDFDIYLFRSFSKNMANSRIFIEELRLRGKIVIESCVSDNYINSKFAEGVRLTRNNLPYPKTYQIPNFKNLELISDNFFPAIVKPADGSKGRDVRIINDKKELADFLHSATEDFLIQERLEIEWDVRVFVVNGKPLGGIKRHLLDGDCRSNASLGSRVEKFKLTPETKKLARNAAKIMRYEVAGVDLAWAKNKKRWYVIEVNISPQWQAFKRITGLNPAKYIIERAVSLYGKKHK